MAARLLGIDYGTKRIGIAVSDPLNIIARGVTVIPHAPGMVAEIGRLAREFDVRTIVVGMPYNLKGMKDAKAMEVEEFMSRLAAELGVEVVPQDERFTSQTAHQTLIDMQVGKMKRRSKGRIDEMASALILQGYLDAHAERRP
jgi:putative Holliday junction resolvase